MRINIYSQELTSDTQLIEKTGSNGETYSAVRLMFHSSSMLHQPPEHVGEEDDRSGVTYWLPKSTSRREELACTFENMARMVREAKPET